VFVYILARVRWVLIAVLTVALGVATLALVTYSTGRVPFSGCRLFSVDEGPFVAANRALLDELPLFPGATRVFSSSSGFSVSNDRCFAFENSGPYDSFQTSDRFTLPAKGQVLTAAPPWYDLLGESAQVPAVLVFYDRELPRRGWRLSHYSGGQIWYRRQGALLCVTALLEARHYELDVVHDA
jgi:hypothetical protein